MIDPWQIVLRLSVAALFGILVGAERERRLRAAGMRTMALVSLGSALFTLVSAYAFVDLLAKQHVAIDPTRIMAQIVTGIGFLGAGVIFLRRDAVRGLTTAAALWVVAGVGMAVGAGIWTLAAAAIVATLVVLAVLRPVERWLFPEHGPQVIRLRIGPASLLGAAIAQVQSICKRAGIVIDSLTVSPDKQGSNLVRVGCRVTQEAALGRALAELREVPGVRSARVDLRGRVPAGA
jgi:putative Mg2+ transporter-C (MgtC) family protein